MPKMTLRLTEELHARLVTRAREDGRSLNNELVHLLELALRTIELRRYGDAEQAGIEGRARERQEGLTKKLEERFGPRSGTHD